MVLLPSQSASYHHSCSIKRASESISLRPSIFCFQVKVLHLQQATLPHVSVCATHSQREHNHQRRHIIIISVHSPPHNQHHRLHLLIQILKWHDYWVNLKQLIPLQLHYHLEIEGAYRKIKEIINIIVNIVYLLYKILIYICIYLV